MLLYIYYTYTIRILCCDIPILYPTPVLFTKGRPIPYIYTIHDRIFAHRIKNNYAQGVIPPQAWIKETETELSDSEALMLLDSNPRPLKVWPDHGPLGFQGSYPKAVSSEQGVSFCVSQH